MKGIINGITMAWDDNGSGPAVCLIHGFPLSRRMWALQVAPLVEAGYRVITPDLRGFGASDAPDGPYSMGLFADDLAALFAHLGIGRAVVVGMSMGGYILFNLLERYPDLVAAPCFIVTRSGGDDAEVSERRRALAADAVKLGSRVVAEKFQRLLFASGTLEERPELAREVYGWMAENEARGLSGALYAMAERKDYTPLLGTFAIPSLVVGAEEDRAVPLAEVQALAAALPRSELCIIPKAGHLANLEQAETFNACLVRFLERLSLH